MEHLATIEVIFQAKDAGSGAAVAKNIAKLAVNNAGTNARLGKVEVRDYGDALLPEHRTKVGGPDDAPRLSDETLDATKVENTPSWDPHPPAVGGVGSLPTGQGPAESGRPV
jgi:hypothetical protein